MSPETTFLPKSAFYLMKFFFQCEEQTFRFNLKRAALVCLVWKITKPLVLIELSPAVQLHTGLSLYSFTVFTFICLFCSVICLSGWPVVVFSGTTSALWVWKRWSLNVDENE